MKFYQISTGNFIGSCRGNDSSGMNSDTLEIKKDQQELGACIGATEERLERANSSL